MPTAVPAGVRIVATAAKRPGRKDHTIFSGEWAMGRIYEGSPRAGSIPLVLVAAWHLRQAFRPVHQPPRANAR
jgi:hypothetical protein